MNRDCNGALQPAAATLPNAEYFCDSPGFKANVCEG
jgi:hypothetical protein